MNKLLLILAIATLVVLLPSLIVAGFIDWGWSGSAHIPCTSWELSASSRLHQGHWRGSIETPWLQVGVSVDPWKLFRGSLPDISDSIPRLTK